jgi:hypothetical protein
MLRPVGIEEIENCGSIVGGEEKKELGMEKEMGESESTQQQYYPVNHACRIFNTRTGPGVNRFNGISPK